MVNKFKNDIIWGHTISKQGIELTKIQHKFSKNFKKEKIGLKTLEDNLKAKICQI